MPRPTKRHPHPVGHGLPDAPHVSEKGNGSPRQSADWLAMTEKGSAPVAHVPRPRYCSTVNPTSSSTPTAPSSVCSQSRKAWAAAMEASLPPNFITAAG